MWFLWAQVLHTWHSKALARGGSISGGLGSGLGGTRRCGEGYSGTTVRIQVQDGVGGCGLGAWSQLALSKALEITLERHRAERAEGRAWVRGPPPPTIPLCPLPHPQVCPSPHSREPDYQRGSGHWGEADAGSCLHRAPSRGRSGATWPLADGSEGAEDAFAGGSRPLLGGGHMDSGRPL